MFIPAWPLYLTAGLLALVHLYLFWKSRALSRINFTLLGKAMAWGLLAGVYVWTDQTSLSILEIRDIVRLGNLLLTSTYLAFFAWDTWLERNFKSRI